MRRLVALATAAFVVVALLSAPVFGHDPSPEAIEATVDEVLSDARYTGVAEDPISRFLQSNPVTEWITDRIQDFIDWLSSLGGDAERTPGQEVDEERDSGISLLAGFLILLVIAGAWALSRRRDAWVDLPDDVDPIAHLPEDELLRRADAAEKDGDFESAVRYRFQAGLKGLDRLGYIEAKETTSTGSVRRQVGLSEFDAVATSFEVATYSEYTATDDDVTSAREGWDSIFRSIKPPDDEDADE